MRTISPVSRSRVNSISRYLNKARTAKRSRRDKTYRRAASKGPVWFCHQVCGENNIHIGIGKEIYYLSGDGLLMPAKKDQPPPDLRYFRKCDR